MTIHQILSWLILETLPLVSPAALATEDCEAACFAFGLAFGAPRIAEDLPAFYRVFQVLQLWISFDGASSFFIILLLICRHLLVREYLL